jgi:hypothetical protein
MRNDRLWMVGSGLIFAAWKKFLCLPPQNCTRYSQEDSAMRNPMQTPFWQQAYASLPHTARKRYAFHMKSAERWELRLDTAIEWWTALVRH